MGLFTPKPYKRLDRLTGKFVTVTPEPKEFNNRGDSLPSIKVGRGGKHKRFDLVLLESKMNYAL